MKQIKNKGEFHSNKPVIQNDITKENEIEKGIDIRYCEECHTLQKLDPDRNSPYHNVCFNCNMKKAILRSY